MLFVFGWVSMLWFRCVSVFVFMLLFSRWVLEIFVLIMVMLCGIRCLVRKFG